MNLNQAIVAGRLTRDPEAKALTSGSTITTFSVATSHTYKKGEDTTEQTEYHDVVVFGKAADNCARYLIKGQLVAVVGRLQTRSWEKDGSKHYRTEIIADNVSFGPKHETSKVPNTDVDYPEPIDESAIPF